MSTGAESYALAPHCALKRIEEPSLYDLQNDELYELSEDAFQFLLKCAQGENPPVRPEDEAFLDYCVSEGLIVRSVAPVRRKVFLTPSPTPSLRYVELLITSRCNLRCRHCYLGESHPHDLSWDRIEIVLREFEELHGLRLLLSGGEPLLHPEFWKLNERVREFAFRSVLLSNGTLITRDVAERLRVHEVQLSLDGMQEGHEALRGEGTFPKTLRAIDYLQEAGIAVSIATMIHRRNLGEFDALASLIHSTRVREWNVDVPCLEGRLRDHEDLAVSPEEAAPFLGYGFGGGFHGSGKNATCGAHLCAIMPNGNVTKCGLFGSEAVGTIEDGLRKCWERIPRITLDELLCHCSEIEDCRGGCRYRAKMFGGLYEPDLFQCYARGVLKGGEKHDHSESH